MYRTRNHAQCTRTHGSATRPPLGFPSDEGAAEVWEVVTLISFAVADTSVLVAERDDRPKICLAVVTRKKTAR